MNRKFIISSTILLLSLLAELLLWNQVFLLVFIFIAFAYAKHYFLPIKKELVWYLLMGFGGALFEVFLVNWGHGWSYTNPQIFGIPIWIPFFWGLVGISAITLYDGITSK